MKFIEGRTTKSRSRKGGILFLIPTLAVAFTRKEDFRDDSMYLTLHFVWLFFDICIYLWEKETNLEG